MTCNFFQGKQTKKLHSIKSCFFSSCLFVIFPHRLKYNLCQKITANRNSLSLLKTILLHKKRTGLFLYWFTRTSHVEFISWKFSSESKSIQVFRATDETRRIAASKKRRNGEELQKNIEQRPLKRDQFFQDIYQYSFHMDFEYQSTQNIFNNQFS